MKIKIIMEVKAVWKCVYNADQFSLNYYFSELQNLKKY